MQYDDALSLYCASSDGAKCECQDCCLGVTHMFFSRKRTMYPVRSWNPYHVVSDYAEQGSRHHNQARSLGQAATMVRSNSVSHVGAANVGTLRPPYFHPSAINRYAVDDILEPGRDAGNLRLRNATCRPYSRVEPYRHTHRYHRSDRQEYRPEATNFPALRRDGDHVRDAHFYTRRAEGDKKTSCDARDEVSLYRPATESEMTRDWFDAFAGLGTALNGAAVDSRLSDMQWNLGILHEIIDKKINVNVADAHGRTALSMVAQYGKNFETILAEEIRKGIEIEIQRELQDEITEQILQEKHGVMFVTEYQILKPIKFSQMMDEINKYNQWTSKRKHIRLKKSIAEDLSLHIASNISKNIFKKTADNIDKLAANKKIAKNIAQQVFENSARLTSTPSLALMNPRLASASELVLENPRFVERAIKEEAAKLQAGLTAQLVADELKIKNAKDISNDLSNKICEVICRPACHGVCASIAEKRAEKISEQIILKFHGAIVLANSKKAFSDKLFGKDELHMVSQDNPEYMNLLRRARSDKRLKKLLENASVDINFQTKNGESVLINSARERDKRAFDSILNMQNVDLNLRDNLRNTALFYAVEVDHWTMVSGLLAYDKGEKVEVNACNENGETALIIAVKNNAVKSFDLLLAHEGIDIDVKDGQQRTASDHAAELGHEEFFRKLAR